MTHLLWNRVRGRGRCSLWWLMVLAAACSWGGCARPIGAHRTTTQRAYEQYTASALDFEISSSSRLILHRYDLDRLFAKRPEEALQQLYDRAADDGRRDVIFALAELSYLHAEKLFKSLWTSEVRRARDYHLAAALFSHWYLFADHPGNPPSPFDAEFRVACDVYSFSVAKAFAVLGPRDGIMPDAGLRRLPFGEVQVQFEPPPGNRVTEYLPADELLIHGLSVRNRYSGLGAPLVALGTNGPNGGVRQRFAATLFLRPLGSLAGWRLGALPIRVEMYSSATARSIDASGVSVPLAIDTTAPLAHSLNETAVWKLGAQQFFSTQERIKTGLHLTQPYAPGKIPVVFVHGTFSSPVWWAEMWNTLRADPVIQDRYQFWMFAYNSGKPLAVSADSLRTSIVHQVNFLDPDRRDPALQQMVVIGHSQGGLLTKLTAVNSGDRLWKSASTNSLDAMKMDEDVRQRMRQLFYFDPVPSVRRLVFISTPHRGSYRANNLIRALVRRFTKLPGDLLGAPGKLKSLYDDLQLPAAYRRVPTSVDGMSPSNPWLLALADLPVVPEVKAHSIIAIKNSAQPPEGTDGVVKYTSAHHPGVASELIVRSSHSCQDRPATIEEVRRILLEHLRPQPASAK